MKVLQVNLVCGRGSTGRIAVDIANSLPDSDECFIAYGFQDTDYSKSIKLLKGGNFQLYKALMITRITGVSGFRNKASTHKLIEWIENEKPDIIHLHNIHGDYLHVIELFSYLETTQLPIVWTLHDCWAFTGRCAYFDYAKCEKWKTGCGKCKNKKAYPISYFFDFSRLQWKRKREAFTKCDNLTIVTPSRWLANLTRESFLNQYPVRVINNGIDIDKFRYKDDCVILREKYSIGDRFVVLGVANAWTHRKGLHFFVELSRCLDENYQIVLIGLNDTQKKQIPHNIITISRTNSVDELASWYSVADVFVNPTLEDNYPTTNLESQACGTPVITFMTGGSPESIVYGEVLSEKTTRALQGAIPKWCVINRNPDQKKKIDYSQFSKEKCAKEYVDLYRELAKR